MFMIQKENKKSLNGIMGEFQGIDDLQRLVGNLEDWRDKGATMWKVCILLHLV